MSLMALILLKLVPQTDPPAAPSPTSDLWQVVPGSVYDGDTLRVVRNGEELKIRLCGIDAPEKDQPLGTEARDYLRSLLTQSNSSVRILTVDHDRYGRTVAEVMGVLGESEMNLNAQMVADGMAYHYAQYSGNCPSRAVIEEAEAIAKTSRVGVWADPGSEKPWEWRQKN